MSQRFRANLAFVLKAYSISRGALARDLGLDKSVVSRWLTGHTSPSPTNLARLTELVERRAPGFLAIDWERELESLARRLGVVEEVLPAAGRAAGLPLGLLERILATTALRGDAYEGMFRSTRPFGGLLGRFIHDHGLIRRDPNGLLRLTMINGSVRVDGWMLPLQSQLFCIGEDADSGALAFGIFHGVAAGKAMAIDGVILNNVLDEGRTPTASMMMFERLADLTGDREADDARFKRLSSAAPLAPEGSVPAELAGRLVRDNGPSELARGGDWLLRLPLLRSVTRAD